MSINYYENNFIGFLELDQNDSKVNLLTADNLRTIDKILDSLTAKPDLKALVILSKKKDIFIAGADIREIEGITDAEQGAQKARSGQIILNKLEDLSIPTIAVVDGVALGGGCEFILACRYRLATFNEKIRIGLPEVGLGIIPGFGGTYRLPRLIGLPEALGLILTGKPVNSEKALRLGLVDRLVPQKGLEQHVAMFINDIFKGRFNPDKYKRRRVKGRQALLEESLLGQWLTTLKAENDVRSRTKGFYPAPLKAIAVIKENFYMDRAAGLELEAKTFGELAITDISKNLIHVFYLSEHYRKLTVEGTNPQPVEKCGIIGAGIMGGGIAQLVSYCDIWVRLKDINYGALALGIKSAAKLYRDLVKKRRLRPYQAAAKMDKITTTLDYSGFAAADIVIEAVVENMDVKRKVFKELSGAVRPGTILATNTSALSVSQMAVETLEPSKVIGLHFFNPVHKMPLVEIITTPQTSKETLATTLAFAKRLGKTPIIVKDSCGFLVNRILLGYVGEAGRLLEDGCPIKTIDKIMTDFGMPMGPLRLSDEVGLDVGIKVMHILAEGLGERFAPVKTFEQIYTKGLLGKKTGKGFYLYPKDGETTVNTEIRPDHFQSRPDKEQALRRMVYLMINEAARCLEENIVDGPGAVDIGMILGAGFPAFRGGLLRYADNIGIAHIVNELQALQDKFGKRFEPAAALVNLKKEKRGFYK